MSPLKYEFKDSMMVLDLKNEDTKRYFEVYLDNESVDENEESERLSITMRIKYKTLEKLLLDYKAFKRKVGR